MSRSVRMFRRLRGQQQGQLVRCEAWEDPRRVQRGIPCRCGLGQPFSERFISRRRIHELGRRRRDDVDAGLEQSFVVRHCARAALRSTRRVHNTVRRSAISSSASPVAATPSGAMPASSPASRPTFSGVCTQTPTNSRSGRSAIARMAFAPTPPVDHTTTRWASPCISLLLACVMFGRRPTASAARSRYGQATAGARPPQSGSNGRSCPAARGPPPARPSRFGRRCPHAARRRCGRADARHVSSP